ncbi:MAG: hypothetical protein ACOCT0_01045 [Halobacteriota archaeon]
MTHDTTDYIDGDITSEDEFDSALQELLLIANDNGIDPRGSWEVRFDGAVPDWEIVVTELAKEELTD